MPLSATPARNPTRILKLGCLVSMLVLTLSGLAVAGGAVALWRARANAMTPADIGRLVRMEIGKRASVLAEPVSVTGMEISQSAFGQTSVFQKHCGSARSFVKYNRMFFEQILSTNWCDPFQPVWEVRMTSEWPARRASQMSIHLIYSADGRLLFSKAVQIP